MLFGYSWGTRGIVFAANIACIGLAFGVGYLVSHIGGFALLPSVLIAVVVSFPVGQVLLLRYLRRYASRKAALVKKGDDVPRV